jgi:hypothetical protein
LGLPNDDAARVAFDKAYSHLRRSTERMLFHSLKSSLKFGLAESLILSGSDFNAPSLRMGIGRADKSVSASLAVGVAPAWKS